MDINLNLIFFDIIGIACKRLPIGDHLKLKTSTILAVNHGKYELIERKKELFREMNYSFNWGKLILIISKKFPFNFISFQHDCSYV